MGMLRGQFDVIEPGAAAPSTEESAPAPCVRCREKKAAPQAYTVQKGDTLARIAKKLYGDAARWREIAAANPALDTKKLAPGATLVLPSPRP